MSREHESTLDVHGTGLPGINEKRVAEIDKREQVNISKILTATEAVERIPAEVFEEGIFKGKVLSAMEHLDGHIREIDPLTIEDLSVLPGGIRAEVLFAIPPQETSQLENGLTEAGFTVDSEDNGLVVKFRGGDTISFLFESKKKENEEARESEQDEESAPNEAGEY